MLQAKNNRMRRAVWALAVSAALLAPTFTAHIYASTAQAEALEETATEIQTEVKTVSEEVIVAHDTVEIPTEDLYVGESVVSKTGQDGVVVKNYSVRYENGEMVSKVLLYEEMQTKPVDTILYVGTKVKTVPTLTGGNAAKPASYKYYLDVSASAYDLSYASCGKRPGDRGYGITASGMKAAVGVVAVDPRVIPLGTKLYIEAVDGSWTYGYAVAGDTGGAIKGNRVDLFFNSYNECIQFGRRAARVYVLE